MADVLFNNARGRDVQFIHNVNDNTPANAGLVILLLTASEGDDAIVDHLTLDALLTAAGNTEATGVTNYSRIVLDDTAGITITINNTTNNVNVDWPDQVLANLGGTVDGTFERMLVCYDPDTTAGDNTTIIPMYGLDVPPANNTTNGQNYTLEVNVNGVITQ